MPQKGRYIIFTDLTVSFTLLFCWLLFPSPHLLLSLKPFVACLYPLSSPPQSCFIVPVMQGLNLMQFSDIHKFSSKQVTISKNDVFRGRLLINPSYVPPPSPLPLSTHHSLYTLSLPISPSLNCLYMGLNSCWFELPNVILLSAAFGGLVQKNKYGQSKQRIGIVAGRRKLAGPLVYREDFKINGFDHLPTLDGNRRFQREKRASELEGSDSKYKVN